VRCYNPPRLGNPLNWISRDHRKVVCVDSGVAFTGGLCIADDWAGGADGRAEPWRDTGIAVRGPAVRDIEAAFADSWQSAGAAPPRKELDQEHADERTGALKAWVIAEKPDEMNLYRLEQLVAEIAERSLWLTDAYFVGTTGYVHALCGAARAGVDVRLLVPGSSNWPIVGALSRVGYRALLEAGVRVFEWNGPMLHAKTAVADGCWSRVGSSNSNLASWTTNRELDVTIQDAGFAKAMADMFEKDLENATEIVLSDGQIRDLVGRRAGRGALRMRQARRSRLVAGAVGLGSTVGAALTRHRSLGAAESGPLFAGGVTIMALALLVIFLPRLLSLPLGLIGLWIGASLLMRAWRTRRGQRADRPTNL
jgi:cardiolipin synthase